MEAEVARGGDEERLKEVALGQGINVLSNVEGSPSHGNRPPEAEDFVQVEGGHLCVVPLVISEVKMVGEGLLVAGKPHGLHQSLASVIKCDDQL